MSTLGIDIERLWDQVLQFISIRRGELGEFNNMNLCFSMSYGFVYVKLSRLIEKLPGEGVNFQLVSHRLWR